MVLISFTRKYDDKTSLEGDGFQFVFYCDVGGEAVESKFVESQAAKKAGTARIIGKGLSIGGGFMKNFTDKIPGVSKTIGKDVEKDIEKGGEMAEKGEGIAEEFAKKFGTMSSEWHREHDEAFENAQKEVKQFFNQCQACNRWACIHCWNPQKSLCIEDAKNTVLCPICHQVAGTGKFCINCGTPLVLKCPKCGETHAAGTKFCANCGTTFI